MEEQIEFLENAGRIITEAMTDEIIAEGLVNSGQLARSPRFKVQLVNGNPELQIFLQDYGFYQDSGVRGTEKGVPQDRKSFNPPGQFRSKVIGGPLPYPVRFVIARDGIKPKPFINEAFDRGIKWMDENIEDSNTEMINRQVQELFSQNGAIVS